VYAYCQGLKLFSPSGRILDKRGSRSRIAPGGRL